MKTGAGSQSGFELYGIFGHPAAHSLSPRMQEAGFRAIGRKAFYLRLDLEPRDYARLLHRRSGLLLNGFNVTVPFKEMTAKALTQQTPEARAVGAVNTVYRRGQRWIGANTDIDGFCRALEKDGRFRTDGTDAVVLGAGGAARAAVYGLARRRAGRITILNRHPQRARKIIADFKRLFPRVEWRAGRLEEAAFRRAFKQARLVVNTTPLGLKKNDPPVLPPAWTAGAVRPGVLFYDLIYRPAATPFLQQAGRRGFRTLGGAPMLLYQGAKAFELWTGRRAPLKVMRQALAEALKQQKRKHHG